MFRKGHTRTIFCILEDQDNGANSVPRVSDLDGSGNINMSEFEVALMMNDAIPKSGIDLTPLDAFYIFDLDQSGEINQVRHETRDTRQ